MGALVTFLVLAMIGAVVYVIWSKTGTTVSVMTSLGKDDLKDSITNFLTQRKYLQVSRSENLMTFAMDQKASCIIALLLFMIGFIPGLLYLFLGGKTKTLTVQFDTLQGQHGSNVRIQGQRSIVNRIRKVVGIPQGALSPNVAPAGHPAISPAPGVAVPAYQPRRCPLPLRWRPRRRFRWTSPGVSRRPPIGRRLRWTGTARGATRSSSPASGSAGTAGPKSFSARLQE